MKLKIAEREESITYSYSKLILFGFSALYLLFPYLLEYYIGAEFYIYSSYQDITFKYSLIFFSILFLTINLIIIDLRRFNIVKCALPSKRSAKIIIWINIAYLGVICARGLPLRLGGASRDILLELISSQLLPGFGFLFLLCIVAVIYLKDRKYLLLFIAVCFVVDIIHQGKIFTSYAVLSLMFYLDNIRTKISLKRIVLIVSLGFSFLLMIFFMRAISADQNPLLGAYSFFSEFMGVNATNGWAYEYHLTGGNRDLSDFDATLREYYVKDVGHGLALSPVAYFIGNYGDLFFIHVILYFIVVFMIFHISVKFIGKYALVILLYNVIHLLRHGPNLFLSKCMFQLIFIIGLIAILNFWKERKYS